MSTTARHGSEGIRLVIVSGLFVAIGIAVRDRVPWYATAFFVVCLLLGVLRIFGYPKYRGTTSDHLLIDDVGITRTAKRLREHVAWGDIARVCIMTSDRGPQLEDVFFV